MRQEKCNYEKLWTAERQSGAHLHVYSWNVEDCGLHVIRFGLQGRWALLAGEEMRGGGVGGLQLLLLGGRLLVQTPEAALTAPAKPTGRTVPLRKGGVPTPYSDWSPVHTRFRVCADLIMSSRM